MATMLQASLNGLLMPSFMVFIHFLATTLTLLLLAAQQAVTLRPFSLSLLHAAAPSALLHGLQVCIFVGTVRHLAG
jgi:hypothetical protein